VRNAGGAAARARRSLLTSAAVPARAPTAAAAGARRVVPCVAALAVAGPAGTVRARRPPPQILRRPSHRPVYSVAVELRVPVVAGGAAAVVSPPVGFGAAFVFRYHGVPLGPARLGGVLVLGHDRVLDRVRLAYFDEDGTARTAIRWAALDQTTFATGPSFQIPLRRVFLEVGGAVGIVVGNLVRPVPGDPARQTRASGVGFVVRGDAGLGIPLFEHHGLLLGASFSKVFSNVRTSADPAAAADPTAVRDTAPFDMTIAPFVGYQGWF